MKKWTVWICIVATSNFITPIYANLEPLTPQTEFEQLAVISTKYGNNPRGIPALHYAILQSDLEAVDLLLKYGASPFTKSAISNYPDILHACVESGNLALFQKFVDLGCDIVEGNYYAGETTLGFAIATHQNELAKFILETSSFDLNRTQMPEQFLSQCSCYGNYEIFELLRNRYIGLEVDYTSCIRYALHRCQNKAENQALHLSLPDTYEDLEGKFKILDWFTNEELKACFEDEHQAGDIFSNTHPEALVYLLDRQILNPDSIFDGIELLRIVCTHSQFSNEMVGILLSRGVDVQKGNCKYALFSLINQTEFSQPVLARKKELIIMLLQAGLDINLRDHQGKTILDKTQDRNMNAFLKSLGAK